MVYDKKWHMNGWMYLRVFGSDDSDVERVGWMHSCVFGGDMKCVMG
jgi:hypothetical protein